MRRRILPALAGAIVAAVWAASAASSAGPSPGLSQGWDGVARGNVRYVAVPAGAATSVQKIDRHGGRVLGHVSVPGTWGIPLVAFDGTAEGLLGDGRTLLLAQPLFSGQTLRKSTSFKLVDVRTLKVRGTVRLPGAFSYDALSPDGHYLYLIEYVSPEDPSLYRVRVYDLRQGRLLARIVADKRSWTTGMQGSPVARVWKDGWAYTLYGGNARPFIHALNTTGVEAVCINLPWKSSPQRLFDFRLRTEGNNRLLVRGPRGRALVVVDRHSFRVLSSVASP
jgi:hypothetical protein